jgi:adenosine kinase
MASETYPLFCMGNPLLDMQVRDGEALLKKYELKANDAILAGPEHYPMCVHLLFDHLLLLLTQILQVTRMW